MGLDQIAHLCVKVSAKSYAAWLFACKQVSNVLIYKQYLIPEGLGTSANKNLNTLIYNVFRFCKSALPNPFTSQCIYMCKLYG